MNSRHRPKRNILLIYLFTVCHSKNVTNSIFKLTPTDCELGEFPKNDIPVDVTDVEFKEFNGMANFGDPELDKCEVGGNPEVVEGIKYIDVIRTETSIELKPKKMDELEEKTESTPSSLLLCLKIIIPGCVKEDDDRLYLKVVDTNNHKPEFIDKDGNPKQVFEYKVSMPFTARIDLYDFGEAIFAKDIDFSNKDVKLGITGDDLEFKYEGVQPGTKNKVHTTKLVVLTALSFLSREYIITVQDSGEPPKSAQGTIMIKRDFGDCEMGQFPMDEVPLLATDEIFTEFKDMANFGVLQTSRCPYILGEEYINVVSTETSIKLEPKNMNELEELIVYTPDLLLICTKINLPNCNFEQEIYLNIKDTNNHPPQFINESGSPKADFIYILPMPIPAKLNLYDFGEKIFVKDIDFSNRNVKFTVSGSDFELLYDGYKEGTNTKVHASKLVALNSLSFPVKQYRITVEDSGYPPLSATGTILVKQCVGPP